MSTSNNIIKVIFFYVIIFSFACNQKQKNYAEQKSYTEEEYLEQRNKYINQFNSKKIDWDDTLLMNAEGKALINLESILQQIIDKSDISDLKKCGNINLATLFEEMGFGMLDGLICDREKYRILVTTEYLFNNYFKEHKLENPTRLSLSDMAKISNRAFYSDAFTTNFSEIPVDIKRSDVLAYSFIGTITQDIGLILPKTIFVIIFKNKKVYIFEKELTKEITEIPICRKMWDSLQVEKSFAYEEYQNSHLENKDAFDKSIRLEEEGWENYCNCYQENLKNQPEFINLKNQAKQIANQIIE